MRMANGRAAVRCQEMGYRRRAGSGWFGRGRGGHRPARTRPGWSSLPGCPAMARQGARQSGNANVLPGSRSLLHRQGLRPCRRRALPDSGQRCRRTRAVRNAGMAGVGRTSRRMAVAMAGTVPGPGRIPCPGVRDVPFPMAHLRRPNRMTDITVSRPGGRSVTHGNILPPPFASVSPHPGMLAFRWRFASSGGSPWSHPDLWKVPAFLSRLSHACPVSLAPDQPAAVRGRRASPRA